MTRAHLYRPVVDADGNVQSDLLVRVLQPDTQTPITAPMYSTATGPAELGNPMSVPGGVISFYLDKPQRVRLGITASGGTEYFYDDVDVLSGDIHAVDVPFDPTATLTPTDVQGALEALDHDLDPLRPLSAEVRGGDHTLTKEQADLLYAPLPVDQPTTPDPETGTPGTEYARFTVQTVVAGNMAVGNLVKPGLRVPVPGQAFAIIARLDTAPTGGPVTITVQRWNNGAHVDDIGTVTVADGSTLGVAVNLTANATKGDILKFDCTAVGSTAAGADLNISVDFR